MRGCLVLVLTFLLELSALGAALADAPHIVSVQITRQEAAWLYQSPLVHAYQDYAVIVAEDMYEGGDITDFTITAPDGSTRSWQGGSDWSDLALGWGSTSDGKYEFFWYTQWTETEWPAGSYTISVETQTGDQDTVTTTAVPVATGLLPTLVSPGPVYGKATDPAVVFQWTLPVSETTSEMRVWTEWPATALWEHAIGSEQSVAYNQDGTAQEPLEAGHAYDWMISSALRMEDPIRALASLAWERRVGVS